MGGSHEAPDIPLPECVARPSGLLAEKGRNCETMIRYFTRPKAVAYDDVVEYYSYHHEATPTMEIHDSDRCRETGVLDSAGNMIFASNSIKCGFIK